MLKRFHVDVRYVFAHGPESYKGGIERNTRDGRLWHDLADEFGVVWSMPDDQPFYMDISHHPLADATIDDLADYPFPKGDDPTRFTGIRDLALRLREQSPMQSPRASGRRLRDLLVHAGLERWYMDTVENPAF